MSLFLNSSFVRIKQTRYHVLINLLFIKQNYWIFSGKMKITFCCNEHYIEQDLAQLTA